MDDWGALGNTNWSWDMLQPYFEKFEACLAPSSPEAVLDTQTQYLDQSVHGQAGPIVTSVPASYGPFMEAWPRTSEGLKMFPRGDPRGGTTLGGYVNLFNIDVTRKERSYPATSYCLPASSRPNFVVITGAIATEVLFDHDSAVRPRATGVSYRTENVTYTVEAKKEVMLSAGSMQSSKLLELSGVEDCSLLSNFGIECRVNNTNVGENFQNHLLLPLG